MKRVSFTLLFLAISWLVAASSCRAELSVSLGPPLLELTIQPGRSVTQSYEVSNNSPVDLYLKPVVYTLGPADYNGNVQLFDSNNHPAFLSLKDLDWDQTFKLAANSRKQLLLKITIPEDTSLADYYYTLMLEQSPSGDFLPGTTSGQNLVRIGTNILITVSLTENPLEQISIEKFNAQPKVTDLLKPITFEVLLANLGPNFLKPNGQITIKPWLSRNQKTLQLLPVNILKNSVRQIDCLEGSCQFASIIPWPYRAQLTLLDYQQTAITQAETNFFVIPIKSGLAFLITISIIVTARIIRLSRQKKDQLDKHLQ